MSTLLQHFRDVYEHAVRSCALALSAVTVKRGVPAVAELPLASRFHLGYSLPIPGDDGAPEMRARVASAAFSCAFAPQWALVEALGDQAADGTPAPLRYLGARATWPKDGKPLFAEGRLFRPEGNLLGGRGLDSWQDFAHDLERAERFLGYDRESLQPDSCLVFAPATAGHVIVEARQAGKCPAHLVWLQQALLSTQDWYLFRTQGDKRAATVHAEDPRCWLHEKDGKRAVAVACSYAFEITNPELCVKVVKRG